MWVPVHESERLIENSGYRVLHPSIEENKKGNSDN